MSLIELKNISKVYGRKMVEKALDDVDLNIKEGEFMAITGPSGSGKSSMLNILGGLDTPSAGTYTLDGQDVSRLSDRKLASIRNNDIGFIFQSFNLLPRMTVLQNVLVPTIYSKSGHNKEKAKKILAQVGIPEKEKAYPNQLSGGQQQRVAIARALILDPKIILADEPTGNLDTKTAQDILDLLKKINQAGNTLILVTHEPDLAAQAGRIIKMRDGKIEERA